MRPSPLRHPLAVLRTTIGLTQEELAALVQRSARTIQAVELGKLPLSEELAMLVAQETGVDSAWLLQGDASVRPRKGSVALWSGLKNTEYDRSFFEHHRAFVECPPAPVEEIQAKVAEELIRHGHPNAGEAAKALLFQAASKMDPDSVRLAKGLMAGPQARVFAREDQQIESALKQILTQCAGSERATLVRWKLRRFLQSIADENGITLDHRPPAPPSPPPSAPSVSHRSGWFQFTPPRGWAESRNGTQTIFRSADGEMAVSTYRLAPVTRGGEDARNAELRKAVLLPALSTPSLKITRQPEADMRPAGVQSWIGEAVSRDGRRIVIQSMYVHEDGLMLATLNASNTDESRMEFDRFARSVSANDEPVPEAGLRPGNCRAPATTEQRAGAM